MSGANRASPLFEDYGLIGNQMSAALVSRSGSIDWCCLPYLDSPSHFSAVLDSERGGSFQIHPLGDFRSEQRYLNRTQVLETVFETAHGRAVLTDWMPIGGGCAQEPTLRRRLEVISGKITWLLRCAPVFGYGATAPRAEPFRGGIMFRCPESGEFAQLCSSIGLEISSASSGVAESRFTLDSRSKADFSWGWGRRFAALNFMPPVDTIEWWRENAHRCSSAGGASQSPCIFTGPWHDAVTRSGLVLKLLLAPYSGAIAESITTSTRDSRYCWLRDSALAFQALLNLGYMDEAKSHFGWLCDILERDGAENLQSVYTLDGGRDFAERELDHLGENSRPLRVGNAASKDFHLCIFGHVMLAASEYLSNFGSLPERIIPKLWEIADLASQAWRRPDHGPWELRGSAEHYVASKVLCWAALDRACKVALKLGKAPPPRWPHERDVIHKLICEQGYDPKSGTFVRSFTDAEVDASLLWIPLLGFLPPEDPRVLGTLDAIQTQLGDGALILRTASDAELPGAQIPLQSSFRFAACLALCGRVDEATDRLSELCGQASSLGLFADGGCFPSASVHVALINAALYIGLARGRTPVASHLVGSERRFFAPESRQDSAKSGP